MKLKNLKIYLLAIFTIFLFNLQTTAMKPSKPQSSQNTSTASNQPINLGTIQINAEQLLNILYNDDENHNNLRTILGSSMTNDFTNELTQPNVTAVSKLDICFLPEISTPSFKISITIVSRNNIPTTYTAVLQVTDISYKIDDVQKTLELAQTDTEIFFFLQRYCEVPHPLPPLLNSSYNNVLNTEIPSLKNSNLLHIIHNTPTNDFTIYTLQNNEIHSLKITYPDKMNSLNSIVINLIKMKKINKFTTLSTCPLLNICCQLCHGDYSFEKILTSFNFNNDIPSNEEKSNDNNGETLFLTQHGKNKNKEKKHSDKKEKEKEHSNESNDGDNTSSSDPEHTSFPELKEIKSNDKDDTPNNNSSHNFFSLSSDDIISNSSNVVIQQMPTIAFDINITTLPTAWFTFTNNAAVKKHFLTIIQNNPTTNLTLGQRLLLDGMIANPDKVNMNYEGPILVINSSGSIKQLVSFTINQNGSQNSMRLFGSFNYKACEIKLNTNRFSPSARSDFQGDLNQALQQSKQNSVSLSNKIINSIKDVVKTNNIKIQEQMAAIFKDTTILKVNYVQRTGNDYLIWISNTKTNEQYIFIINFSNDQINQN